MEALGVKNFPRWIACPQDYLLAKSLIVHPMHIDLHSVDYQLMPGQDQQPCAYSQRLWCQKVRSPNQEHYCSIDYESLAQEIFLIDDFALNLYYAHLSKNLSSE